ncbi:hypothetical protein NL676_014636 [Syzygium grande]|nr:hypothetical protein NL676_014636 [Syzygium grande]
MVRRSFSLPKWQEMHSPEAKSKRASESTEKGRERGIVALWSNKKMATEPEDEIKGEMNPRPLGRTHLKKPRTEVTSQSSYHAFRLGDTCLAS